MNQLVGNIPELGWVALKAILLYATAVVGFRLGERRTLAEMSAFDFVAAVAVGAIIGRVPNSDTTSYLAGTVTLVTVLIGHRIVTRVRMFSGFSALFDHPPRLLVCKGQVLESSLRRAGLTRNDLYGLLRQKGVLELQDVHLVIFEQRGKITVIRKSDVRESEPELVREVIESPHHK